MGGRAKSNCDNLPRADWLHCCSVSEDLPKIAPSLWQMRTASPGDAAHSRTEDCLARQYMTVLFLSQQPLATGHASDGRLANSRQKMLHSSSHAQDSTLADAKMVQTPHGPRSRCELWSAPPKRQQHCHAEPRHVPAGHLPRNKAKVAWRLRSQSFWQSSVESSSCSQHAWVELPHKTLVWHSASPSTPRAPCSSVAPSSVSSRRSS